MEISTGGAIFDGFGVGGKRGEGRMIVRRCDVIGWLMDVELFTVEPL